MLSAVFEKKLNAILQVGDLLSGIRQRQRKEAERDRFLSDIQRRQENALMMAAARIDQLKLSRQSA